jgi:hypothetical protein
MPKPTPTFGVMGFDWEQRVDLDRLRTERSDRIKGILAEADAYWGCCYGSGQRLDKESYCAD